MEQVPSTSPLFPYISVDPERMSGEPVFRGSRVPIQSMFDYLMAGDSLDEFLRQFEGIPRSQAQAVLNLAAQGLLGHLGRAA
jgi:uncharacterized protein (DUF433 family)